MTQAVRSTYIVLDSDELYSEAISALIDEWMILPFQGGLVLKADISDMKNAPEIDATLILSGFRRLFERCYFPDPSSTKDFNALVEGFFSLIADEYDVLIEAEWNYHCYRHLFDLARPHLARNCPRTLDFGCGDGTIMGTHLPQVADVVGFDASPKMRLLASARGLRTLNFDELQNLPRCSFDLIMSAYVLHYHVQEDLFMHLMELMENGGIFVGNFHKGFEKNSFGANLDSLMRGGYTVEWQDSQFGPCIVIRKHKQISNPNDA